MWKRALRLCLSLSIVAFAAPSFAQQTGSIAGNVKATDGSVLPGVTVEARSSVLPGPRVTTTGGNGDYRLPALPPGEYAVTFSLSGMQTLTRSVSVKLLQEATIDTMLGVGGVTEEVTVTADISGFVDKETASVTTGLSSAQLAGLPLGTEYRDLLRIIPGLHYTQDVTRGQSAGGSGQDNVYQFDGVNVTTPLFGTLAAEPSAHDIAQVTLIKGGARAVDFDRSGGFSVDSVSKSGTDKFAGEVTFRLQSSGMASSVKTGSLSRFDRDRTWGSANLGGPLVKDRLYFYGSYYRPTESRENRANAYGDLPPYDSKRNEGFGKLTFTPQSSILLNFSYRQSKRVETSSLFDENAAATTGSGNEIRQKIITADGSWIINPKSYATFKFTRFENPNQGRPDNTANVNINTAAGTQLDINNLDSIGRFSVPSVISGQTAFNTFIQPILNRYGYVDNGVRTGGGVVGYGAQFDNNDFFRTSGQIGYNLTVGDTVRHDLHIGYQRYTDSEDLTRTSNGWGRISVPGGRTSFRGTPIYYLAAFQQQGTGLVPTIHSEYQSQSIEFNDAIRVQNWTINLGLLASNDTLYGQGLREDSSTLSGYVASPGTKYKMYETPFSKMLQPRVGATYAYNGEDTVYASFARYNPAASSLPRAASWDRNVATTIQAYFDQNGVLFAIDPLASSSGKLFVEDMTPRRVDEFLLGTARQVNANLALRAYGRYRKGSHFWEDTNNTARSAFGPPPGIPTTDYIPDLNDRRAQIGSGSSYVIAELDGAYTKYWEGTVELEWRSPKGLANVSYTRSHYYGNFDQDNSSTAELNDGNIFIGSSNIADGAGRQLWNNKDGDLHGDRPHLFKVAAIRNLHWKASAGLFFVFQSGHPWESTDYEPYRAFTTSTSSTNRYAEPAGSRRAPSHTQVDFNYSQDISLSERLTLQLVANVFNLFDKQTGYDFQPNVHASDFAKARRFYDPRRLEVEARVRF